MTDLPAVTTFTSYDSLPDLHSVRKDIESLNAAEISRYREAVHRLMQLPLSDPRSYYNLAGYHHFPGDGSGNVEWCAHGVPSFISWHRWYLRLFERCLQSVMDDGETVAIPYWNSPGFGKTEDGRPFVPSQFNVAPLNSFTLPDGNIGPAWDGMRQSSRSLLQQRTTFRSSNQGSAASDRTTIRSEAVTALRETTWAAFTQRTEDAVGLETPHNRIHDVTGGWMGDPVTAAFDPIFWSHHAFIDLLADEWETRHPNSADFNGIYAQELAPYQMKNGSFPLPSLARNGGKVSYIDPAGLPATAMVGGFPPGPPTFGLGAISGVRRELSKPSSGSVVVVMHINFVPGLRMLELGLHVPGLLSPIFIGETRPFLSSNTSCSKCKTRQITMRAVVDEAAAKVLLDRAAAGQNPDRFQLVARAFQPDASRDKVRISDWHFVFTDARGQKRGVDDIVRGARSQPPPFRVHRG